MCRKILVILSVAMFIPWVSRLSFAQNNTEPDYNVTETSKEAVLNEVGNVENEICPVSDEAIKEKTKVNYEYEGKIYNLCCPACIAEFKKDPKKYIEKVEQELQSPAKKKHKRSQYLRKRSRNRR